MTSRPRLLDAFSGAGGAAMGYHRAGFDVVGVDHRPMPRYPFEFHQADALEYIAEHGAEFDAIHASPPCFAYANVTRWRGRQADHPRLIAPTRELLLSLRAPWVIENVRTRELIEPTCLCGTAFGLRVRRHRYFETGGFRLPTLTLGCDHSRAVPFDHGGTVTESAYREALGVPWMTVRESRQAIPPAMTEWIGAHLLAALRQAA